jgi:colanic acid/amylovoran biosynthesis glycosyltransferase
MSGPQDRRASLSAPIRLAYVIVQFPRLSETFILREIVGLRRRGMAITIFSLLACRDAIVDPEAAPLQRDTVYCPLVLSGQVIRAHLHFLARRPVRYFSTLFYVVSRNLRSLHFLLRTLATFPRSVYFARLMREQGITHIHAHWATMPTVSALIASRLLDLPYSFSAHASDIFVDQTMLAEKVRNARFVVTCSRFARDYLASTCRGAVSENLVVNYHGVDLVRQPGDGSNKRSPPLILSVGRLVAQKGYPYLIDACASLRRVGRSLQCTIVGNGPDRELLLRQIEEAGLGDTVRLTGPLPFAEVMRLYDAATLFALPCVVAPKGDRDGIPNVLLEAMAMQLPVISTPVSGIPELVADGETGLLVPERDAGALAGAIALLLDDPAVGTRLGRQARERVARDFDVERNVQSLYGIFVRRCSTSAAGPSTS